MNLTPQFGFQYDYLNSTADIAIGGGSAGAGKTFASLLLPLYDYKNPNFGAVFFRRTYSQITNMGGLWDESKKIYYAFKAKPNETELAWTFPEGSQIKFSHLQYEKDIYTHQGAQYPLIIFDELTHFTSDMFWYLLSRNRSTCGVKPMVRATCNPDPDSFVANLLEWWIDQETGFPIPERSGKLRYFFRESDILVWGQTKQEVIDKCPHIFNKEKYPEVKNYNDLIKSLTFIPGSIYENKELLKVDPGYLGNLMAQNEDEKARLLHGNWKVKLDGLSLFEYSAVDQIFENYTTGIKDKYITCDHARLGSDFAVIFVWHGWDVMKTLVFKKSEAQDVVNAIEIERMKYGVPKTSVIVDQDGVGSGVVKIGGYIGFSGGAQPFKSLDLKLQRENYKNLKTQCYYHLAERVNTYDIRININSENTIIYEAGHFNPQYTSKMLFKGQVTDIRDLIKKDLRAIKKVEKDLEGKLQINSKEAQKNILGRSPDFGDSLSLRSYFDLIPTRKKISVYG